MASSMIHIAVASEINKTLKRDTKSILIGTISPDISKHIGESKLKSHFLNNDTDGTDIPNLELFLNKYKKYLNDDFVLGYYIHLYTDYLWFKYFIPEITDKYKITKLDGTVINCNPKMFIKYIYNDYTNLNVRLIDEYDLDLKFYYNEVPKFNNIIGEIPMDKLYLIVNAASVILENSKTWKSLVFDFDNIKQFIKMSEEIILSDLKERGIY